MKQILLTLIVFFVQIAALNGQSKPSGLYDIKLKKVKDNIYLAYRDEPLRPYVERNF